MANGIKIKKLCVVMMLVGSMNVASGTLDYLKKTPASKFEMGLFQLEVIAHTLTEKQKGDNVGGTKFEIGKYYIENDGKIVLFVASLKGRAKNMNEAVCSSINTLFKTNQPFKDLKQIVWPGLTDKQYSALDSEFVISTELVSDENSSFKITCK